MKRKQVFDEGENKETKKKQGLGDGESGQDLAPAVAEANTVAITLCVTADDDLVVVLQKLANRAIRQLHNTKHKHKIRMSAPAYVADLDFF